MIKWRIRRDRTPSPPQAGADAAVFGLAQSAPMPYLERLAHERRQRAATAGSRQLRRRAARRSAIRAVRRASRSTLVRLLELAGAACLTYAGWLTWVPLGWTLIAAFLFLTAFLIDQGDEDDER